MPCRPIPLNPGSTDPGEQGGVRLDSSRFTVSLPQAASALQALSVSSSHPLLSDLHPIDPRIFMTIFFTGVIKESS